VEKQETVDSLEGPFQVGPVGYRWYREQKMAIADITRAKIFRRSLFLLVILAAFSYGATVGAYKLFPYRTIRASVKYVIDIPNKIDRVRNITDDYSTESHTDQIVSPFIQYHIDNIEHSYDTRINNFDIYRSDYIELDKIDRLAYLDFDDGLLSVYSQDDYSIVADMEIDEKDFEDGLVRAGGVRSLFFYKDNLVALVALADSETECAYASLVNITLKTVLLEFPCVPQFELVDFGGVGGGFVSIPASETLLLALGVPETRGEEIRALAQSPSSPYGKILKIPESTILGNGNDYAIYTSGHRNPQSMLYNGEKIIAVEHGPRGGDEINLIEEGKNYGWPVASLGSHYDFQYIDKTYEDDNTEERTLSDPLFAFIPAIAPSVIGSCPLNYEEYYRPNRCILLGSLRARSLFFVQIDETYSRVLAVEKYEHGSRMRKLIVEGDNIVIGTDYEGNRSDYDSDDDYAGISFLKLRPIAEGG